MLPIQNLCHHLLIPYLFLFHRTLWKFNKVEHLNIRSLWHAIKDPKRALIRMAFLFFMFLFMLKYFSVSYFCLSDQIQILIHIKRRAEIGMLEACSLNFSVAYIILPKLSQKMLSTNNLVKDDKLIRFFYCKWHEVAFILLFTSQLTVLNNDLCALDTTLRVLIT